MLYFFYLIILYIILWYKGNAKILYGTPLAPWQWWLSTGLITNYLGLTAWWYLVSTYNVWGALAISYCLHTTIELSLSFYYYDLPSMQQAFGLLLIASGGFLILK